MSLRSKLIRCLNAHGARFDINAFVEEAAVDEAEAKSVAESVFERFVAVVLADDEITTREQRQLDVLAKRLRIPRTARRRIYKKQLQCAEADGAITSEERENLLRLKRALGFGSSGDQRVENASEAPDQPRNKHRSRRSQTQRSGKTTDGNWIEDEADRTGVFEQLEASPEFATCGSETRLSQLRRRAKRHAIRLALRPLRNCGIGYLLIAALFHFPVLVNLFAGNPRLSPAELWGGLMSTFIVFFVFGVVAFGGAAAIVVLRRRSSWRIEREDITSVSVIVIAKREKKSKQDHYWYYATFMDRHGDRFEHQLSDKKLAEQFYSGDAGILFVHRDKALDFDRVLTAQTILEAHIQGAVECLHCESVYQLGSTPTTCENCGSNLHDLMADGLQVAREYVSTILAPFQRWMERDLIRAGTIYDVPNRTLKDRVEDHVTCGWCHHLHHVRPASPNCQKCGGVLPMFAGELGAEPPPVPRRLPTAFIYDLFYGKQKQLKICLIFLVLGVVFGLLFVPFFILAVVGFLGALENLIASRRRWLAYSRGVPVLGKIDRVQRIESAVRVDNKKYDKYRVFFRFQADGKPVRGMISSYDSAVASLYVGEQVWIVYVRGKPHLCALWPPLA